MILEDDVVDGEERHTEVVGVDFVSHADLLEDAVVDGEERHEERHIEVVSVDFVIHANLLGDAVVDCFLLDEFKKSIGNTSSAMLW